MNLNEISKKSVTNSCTNIVNQSAVRLQFLDILIIAHHPVNAKFVGKH
jgi:hypothetical protein